MTKEEKYKELLLKVSSLIKAESDDMARLANIASLIHYEFRFWWTGFYFVKGEDLVLGTFQGHLACTRIKYGKGVCGTAWKERCSIVVGDVEQFVGHIACSSESKSEIVVPIIQDNEVVAVLDIDSKEIANFDEVDRIYLEKVVKLIADFCVFPQNKK